MSIYKNFKYLNVYFLFLVLLFSGVSSPALTDDTITFSNKTYFTTGRFDRIYFAQDGTFQQQLESALQGYAPGDIIGGTWVYNMTKKELCLDYSEATFGEHCMMIDKVRYDDGRTELFQNEIFATGLDGQDHFIWRHWREGNWLLEAEAFSYLPLAFNLEEVNGSEFLDNNIAAYFQGRVFDGYGFYDYAIDGERGVQIEKATGNAVQYNWSVNNLRTVAVNSETQEELFNGLFTIGIEFIEPKETRAVEYVRKDIITLEGEGFRLIPFEDFQNKEIFAPHIN
jgi:hypothetical protein